MGKVDMECSRFCSWDLELLGRVLKVSRSEAAASIRDHCSLLFLGFGLCQQRVPRGEAEGAGSIPDPAPALESNLIPRACWKSLSCPKISLLKDLLDVEQLCGAGCGSLGGRHVDIPHSMGHPTFYWTCLIPFAIPHSIGHPLFHRTFHIPSDIPHSTGYPAFHWTSLISSDIPHSIGYPTFHPTPARLLGLCREFNRAAAEAFLGYFCLIP